MSSPEPSESHFGKSADRKSSSVPIIKSTCVRNCPWASRLLSILFLSILLNSGHVRLHISASQALLRGRQSRHVNSTLTNQVAWFGSECHFCNVPAYSLFRKE